MSILAVGYLAIQTLSICVAVFLGIREWKEKKAAEIAAEESKSLCLKCKELRMATRNGLRLQYRCKWRAYSHTTPPEVCENFEAKEEE